MGQYSMQAGEPAHPVQQSVVIARIRGLFLRVALPSPSDIGHSFSTMSNTFVSGSRLLDCNVRIGCYLNTARSFAQRPRILNSEIALLRSFCSLTMPVLRLSGSWHGTSK